MGRLARALLLALSTIVASAVAADATPRPPSETFTGTVMHVTDGDTLWVRPLEDRAERRKPVKVRLVGLDAPERCQPHGAESGEALARLVLHREVAIRRRATDDYGRALGTLWLDGHDVGARLVRDGHAWSARFHGDAGPYAQQEREARDARRGLFASPSPQSPRDFRREHGPCH